MNVAIIGAGLIGNKRAVALTSQDKLIAVADTNLERAKKIAEGYSTEAVTQWESLLTRTDIEAVIIATTNNVIPVIAEAFLKAGKHVLIEKPGGRNPVEVGALATVAKNSKGVLCVGFNHRFHPALKRAHTLLKSGEFGPLMYIRARYGHGGRLGYDKEWRADAKIAGGGELLDQGVHLIDLCRWLGGEFQLQHGHVGTYFWDMPVEDNGFLILESPDKKKTAFLHASCTEWKNIFDFEIFAKTAKIHITGLGRSYGVEELKLYRMKPEMGPPDLSTETFAGEDLSWNEEWAAFKDAALGKPSHIGNITDALGAVSVVHAAYAQSKMPYAR